MEKEYIGYSVRYSCRVVRRRNIGKGPLCRICIQHPWGHEESHTSYRVLKKDHMGAEILSPLIRGPLKYPCPFVKLWLLKTTEVVSGIILLVAQTGVKFWEQYFSSVFLIKTSSHCCNYHGLWLGSFGNFQINLFQ